MSQEVKTFYYSNKKLGLYVLFNCGLMALAILFTWSIFPDYQPIYYFSLSTCLVSILSSLFVFLIRMPLAVINSSGIKIDHNHPLKWTQIKSVEKCIFKHFGYERKFLKIIPQRINRYKMSFMQKLTGNSQFGAFSIPLYAMNEQCADEIEQTINKMLKTTSVKPKSKKKTTKNKL